MKRNLIKLTLAFAAVMMIMTVAFAQEDPVRVAVIDTGISPFAVSGSVLVPGKNYIIPENDTMDILGHGTAIASLIVGSEKAGVTGLCPEAEVVPLVFYSQKPSGAPVVGDIDMVAQMIVEAIDVYDCDIINFSSTSIYDSPALNTALAYAEEKGVLVVCTVGNDGTDKTYYPGLYESVLCVGSLDQTLTGVASFSNRNTTLDVIAPGYELTVASIKGLETTMSGTSFSAAYVSGVAAQLMTEFPALTAAEVRRILCASADDMETAGYDTATGWGAVNLERARTYAASGRLFRDVGEKEWFFSSVSQAVKLGLMNGTDRVTFTPGQWTTHAMVWTMLYRMEGLQPSANSSLWYADAQKWVMETGISDGADPNGWITREQLALTLYRYAQAVGYDVSQEAEIGVYHDASQVSSWAVSAMRWACGAGLLNGSDGALLPNGNATRAQVAAILCRFHDKIAA